MKISKIFKANRITRVEYKYSEEFIKFILTRIIYENPLMKLNCMSEMLCNYDFEYERTLNKSALVIYLKANFCVSHKTSICLFPEQFEKYSIFANEYSVIDYLFSLTYDKQIEFFLNTINNKETTALVITAIKLLDNVNESNYEFLSKCYYALFDNKNNDQFKEVLENINDVYLDIDISSLVEDERIKNIMDICKIKTFKDLFNYDFEILVCIFKTVLKQMIDLLSLLQNNHTVVFTKYLEKIYSHFSYKEVNVILKRNSLFDEPVFTLEDIGKSHSITRERVRQIERDAVTKIRKYSKELQILTSVFFRYFSIDNKYMFDEQLKTYICDIETLKKFLVLIIYNDYLGLKYDKEYHVLYNFKTTSIDNLIQETLKSYKDVVFDEEIPNIATKTIIRKHYFYLNGTYRKRGKPFRQVLSELIDLHFPNGYRTSSDEDYNKLLEKYKLEYYKLPKDMTKKTVKIAVENCNYRLVGKSLYKNPKLCPELPDDLIQRIRQYITERTITYYNSIFSEFEDEFRKLNIDNVFFVKGSVDYYLTDFQTSRDYIQTTLKTISARDEIASFINSLGYVFHLNDLHKAFPGVKEYTFMMIIYEIKGLALLSGKRILNLNKVKYSKEFIDFVECKILDLFDKSSTKILSLGILFEAFKDMISDFKIVKEPGDVFVVVRELFPTRFYYKRPFLSICPFEFNSTEELIIKHIKTLEQFTKKEVNSFCEDLMIARVNNYAKFIHNISHIFVQVDENKMVRKDIMNVSEDFIKDMNYSLDLLLSQQGEINTSVFKKYYLFPQLDITWNKYLLKGIVESYLSEKYTIIQTLYSYNNTDFIIKRM